MLANKAFIAISLGFVLAFTVFHASMVLLVNSPSNAIERALAPVIMAYNGPWLEQAWSVFAPDVPTADFHVIVRGRTSDAHTTQWYDATQFFEAMASENRFTTLRPSSEGLHHAENFVVLAHHFDPHSLYGLVLVRTSAMVLETYAGSKNPSELQIEIDRIPIEIGPEHQKRERTMATRLQWLPFPQVQGFL